MIALRRPAGSVEDPCPPDVVLERDQEGGARRELRDRVLRLVVEVVVVRQLTHECGEAATPRKRGHPQTDDAHVLLLRDRLERLELPKPGNAHAWSTPRGHREVRG